MSQASRSIHFLNWTFDPDTVLDRTPRRRRGYPTVLFLALP